jgi:LmbE family N-acetylglucosaminyl deacetylase
MMVADTRSLFGKILVVVAHQDDETACGILLQRARNAQVVFATDGAPSSAYFWSGYGSRREYALQRCDEAIQALRVIGAAAPIFFAFPDQELFRCLPSALEGLENLTLRFKPDALVAPAYEGGHPDPDACSFLTSTVGRRLSIPRWEMPLYHRSPAGTLLHQEFRVPLGGEILLHPTALELQRRDEMLSRYISQPDVTKFVKSRFERFRPQPRYDYSRPPHPGPLNYEVWEWPMTSADLCAAFMSCGLNRTVAAQPQ